MANTESQSPDEDYPVTPPGQLAAAVTAIIVSQSPDEDYPVTPAEFKFGLWEVIN